MNFEKVRNNYAKGLYKLNGNYSFKQDLLNAIKDVYGFDDNKVNDIYNEVLDVTQKSKNVDIYNFISDLSDKAHTLKLIQDNFGKYEKDGLI